MTSAWKQKGPILVSVLHKFVTYHLLELTAPRTTRGTTNMSLQTRCERNNVLFVWIHGAHTIWRWYQTLISSCFKQSRRYRSSSWLSCWWKPLNLGALQLTHTHTHTHNHCAQQTFPPHSHLCHLLAQCCMYDCLLPKDTCGWVEVGFTSSKHCLTNINNVTITVNHLLRRNNLTECLRVRLLLLLCIVVDWVKVLHPTQHKIDCHFWDALPRQSLGEYWDHATLSVTIDHIYICSTGDAV